MVPQPIVETLRRRLQGLEETSRRLARIVSVGEGVDSWLPQGGLPAGCIHEVKGTNLANAVALASILSARVAGEEGKIFFLSPDRSLHALGLLPYGVHLPQLLHLSIRRPPDLAWALMETLRCSQVSAVIALVHGLDLTESRRLQLAAESFGVTAFLVGDATSAPIASPITRWRISPAPRAVEQNWDEPAWLLELLYCRSGRPGRWRVVWRGQTLQAETWPARCEEQPA